MDKNKKSTQAFRKAIDSKLQEIAQKDPLFAKNLNKEGKTLDNCIQYIFNTVQQSGLIGFTDDEVYQMAIHYYDEDNIDIGKPMQCFVAVNHQVELTEEEKKEAKQKALEELIRQEKERMSKKTTPKPVAAPVQSSTKTEEKPIQQTSLF